MSPIITNLIVINVEAVVIVLEAFDKEHHTV